MVAKNKKSKKKVKKISLRKSRRKTSKKSKKKSRKVSKKKIKQNLKKSYRKKKIRRSSTKKKKVKKVKKVRVINKKKLKKLRVSRVKSKRKRGLRVYTKKRRQKGAALTATQAASTIVNNWVPPLPAYEVTFSRQLLELYYGDILPKMSTATLATQFGNPNGIPDASPPILSNAWSPVLRLLALQTYIRYFDPVHFNNDTFNQRWLFIVLFDYLLDHIHDFAKGPRNITTLSHSDILVDKLKKRRPETDQVFVFGLPYIDNFLKSLDPMGIQTPDSSSITWEMIYLPSIKLFHEKCFKTIMIPNENDVLNFIINQVCEGDMSVEQIDSKNILVGRHSLGKYLVSLRKNMSEFVAGDEGIKSFIKDFIKTINNQYFSKLEPFKERIIKDESINIGGLLGLFTRALKIPIRKGGVLQEVFPNVIDPGSGSLSNVIAQMKMFPDTDTVRTSIKGVPDQFITLRSYKPITLYYIKIEIQPTNSTEIIRVSYKDGSSLLPLGILDDSALSVDNVFVAYDYYIELVGGGESTPRSATGSLGMLYNLVWNLFYKNEPENVVIAILLDLKKGGDWLQVDFATMNNKGFETEDRECMAYAILVSCAVVFRYNYSSNGLLGAIKKIFTKIKERATVGAQVGGMVMAQQQQQAAAPQSDPGMYKTQRPTAQRKLSFGSAQSQPLSPVEILVNELDNFSTGEIEYYGDYSDLIEELYDDDVMEKIRNHLLANLPDINTDFGLIELEKMFSGVVQDQIRRVFPEIVQEGGLRFEGITERSEYITSAQKILNNLINPSSFGSGLQIMCPYTRMELIITPELIKTLGEIPKKIKLLQSKVPGVFLTTISNYMNQLIGIVVGQMSGAALDSEIDPVIEKEYRRIIKIYEALKKIVSNITSFTDLDAQPIPRDRVVPPGILQWQESLALAADQGSAPPQPPPVATLKVFLKKFKPFHKTALKNKKIIRKIIEDYEKLELILTLPPNGDTTIPSDRALKDLRVKSEGGLREQFKKGIDVLLDKNSKYITTLREIQKGVSQHRDHLYKTIESLNESIIQEATIDIMHGARGSWSGRSEEKIIKAYELAIKQFPVGFEPSYGRAEQTWINENFPRVAAYASKAAIKSVLQKIPSFKKYKFAATARAAGSTKVRDGFNELVLVKKEIKKIEKIAKFIES